MPKTKYKNFAVSTLLNPISATAVSLSCQSGDGSLFPSLSSGEIFWLTLEEIDSEGNILGHEILKVTARSGDAFTVVRAQQGTSARSWDADVIMELRPTMSDFDGIIQGLAVESDTWNPGSIADGDMEAHNTTVAEADMGDFVLVSSNLDLQDLQLTASVTAANTVTSVLSNSTGGAVNLDEITLKIRVIKA